MKFGFVVTAAALMFAFTAAASAQDAAPSGDAKAGAQTFKAIGCWECHGTVGQGGAVTAPRIGATALPYAAFIQQLRTPQNAMPPYEPAILSDGDAANIYAFLKSLPAPGAAKDIPLLNN
jgi:ubiquinol-cytochrome c reductase cytochrome c subunit